MRGLRINSLPAMCGLVQHVSKWADPGCRVRTAQQGHSIEAPRADDWKCRITIRRYMAILKLRSITCLGQAETFTDELYVTFNGTKRSLPNMKKGQTKALSDEFLFSGSRQLSLFEND